MVGPVLTRTIRKDYIVVDVREPENYEKNHIPFAVNIPHEILITSTPHHLLAIVALQSQKIFRESKNTRNENTQPLEHSESLKLGLPSQLIFHCRLSLIRGPEAATKFCKIVENEKKRTSYKKILEEFKFIVENSAEFGLKDVAINWEKQCDEEYWNKSVEVAKICVMTGGFKAWLDRNINENGVSNNK